MLELARAILGQSQGYPHLRALAGLLFLALLLLWSRSLQWRVVFPSLRHAVRATGMLIFFWLALRCAQFLGAYSVDLAHADRPAYMLMQTRLLRASWEASWLMFALLPALFLRIMYLAAPADDGRAPLALRLHGAAGVALWAARFVPGWGGWAARGLIGWIALSALVLAALLVRMMPKLPEKKSTLTPLALLAGYAAYCLLWFGPRPAWLGETGFIAATSLSAFAFLESSLRFGLLPCNSGWEKLFARARAPMAVYDAAGNEVWRTAGSHREGMLRRNAPIPGGTVVWEEDTSPLRLMRERLSAAKSELERGSRLLARSNRIRGRLFELRWQNALCAEVEEQMRSRIDAARALLDALPRGADPASREEARTQLARLGVLMCAIKRKSHLYLKSRGADELPLGELLAAAQESARCASRAGVDCSADGSGGAVSGACALAAYDLFEGVLERCVWSAPAAVLARFAVRGGRLELRLLIDGAPASCELVPPELAQSARAAGGECEAEADEDGVRVFFSLPARMAQAAQRAKNGGETP